MHQPSSRFRWLIPVLVVLAAVRCGGADGVTLPAAGLPAAITILAGNAQLGVVGTPLRDTLVVRVTDAVSRPVQGQAVLFSVVAGGAGAVLIPDTVSTDADGRARSRWVLGQVAGLQRVEARVLTPGSATILKVSFDATAAAGPLDTIVVVRGAGQTGMVGTALADSLVVRATDRFGNPLGGHIVNWAVLGGGSVSTSRTTTGSDGQAGVIRVLGLTAGAQSATATLSGARGSPVTFSHTATSGGATTLVKDPTTDIPSAPAGSTITAAVFVRDANGNGVAQVNVNWLASAGSSLSANTSQTDLAGRATVQWTLATSTAAPNTLSAVAANLTPVQFSVTGTGAQATTLAANSSTTLNGTAGQNVTPVPSVKVTDANSNGVPGVTVTFTASGGTLSNGITTGPSVGVPTSAAGIATLTGWTLPPAVGNYTVTATATGGGGQPLTPPFITFNATANPGGAASLVFTQQPTTVTAGASIAPAITVTALDVNGNVATGFTQVVTVALGANPGNGTLSGLKAVNAVLGVASFGGLSIDKAGVGYSLTAGAGGLGTITSSAFTVNPGAATVLGFTQQPTGAAAGATIAPPVQVALQDALGNTVPTASATINIALGANPGGATLGGTPSQGTVAGVASFGDLSLNKAGTGYTLTAAANGFATVTSAPFAIGSGTATRLAFVTQPASAAAGAAISPAVQVAIQDAGGNTVTTATDSVAIAIGTNPGGGVLSGTLKVAAVSGIATFSTLSINRTGTGYTLAATSGTLTGATSAPFNITIGGGLRLVFTGQPPASVTSGVVIAPAVMVTVQDALGNTATASTAPVTLALTSPGGATLGGTLVQNAQSGVATFSNLTVDKAAASYTLSATTTTSGIAAGTSNSFAVVAGSAKKLAFTTQPQNAVAGSPMSPVQVTVQDSLGNTVTTATTAITVAIGTNPAGGALSGTTQVNAAAGVATFSTLQIDKAGTGYTLTANGGGLPQVASAAFNVQTGNGSKLAFLSQPTNTTAGVAISPPFQVAIQDAGGNILPGATDSIRLSLTPPSGGLGGTIGTRAVSGIATFGNVSIASAGVGYTLTAFAPLAPLVSATSNPFTVSATATATSITNVVPATTLVGQSYTVSFTVTSVGGTPTGVVTVSDGTDSCASGLSTGVGSCGMASSTAGAKNLVATYSGDNNFSPSVSAAFGHPVNKASTITTIAGDLPDPSVTGQPVTVTWITGVVAPATGTPTGSVTVTLSGGAESCSAPVNSGTCSITPLAVGGRTLTVSYGGDPNYNASSGTNLHTVNKAATTVTVGTVTPSSAQVGQPVTVPFTVVATAPGGGTPTGTITVSDGATSCTASVATGTCTWIPATAGTKVITASYPGDANYLSGSGSLGGYSVVPATTVTTITGVTPPSPSSLGTPLSVSVQVTANTIPPTGSVSVSDGTVSCTATLNSGGIGSCNLTLLSAGPHNLEATYTATPNFVGSISPGFPYTVSLGASTTLITGDTPDPSTVGQSVTVTVSVSGIGGTPSGSVSVADGLGASCTVTLSGGVGSCALAFASVGARTLTASYLGDTNFFGSSDTEPHAVNPAPSTTTITSASAPSTVVGEGYSVSFTVGSTGGTPTGSVTVSDGSQSCGGTLTGGSGACLLTSTTAGAKNLVASYLGDGNFSPSASPPFGHTVNQAGTTTAITTVSLPATTVGQPYTVNFTVVVTAPGAGTPTGNVTVGDGTDSCTGTVAAGSCSLTSTTAGAKTLVATYAGDLNFAGSFSAGTAHTVTQATTTTAITGSLPNPSVTGQGYTVSFAVAVTAPGAGTPTGNVTVTDGADTCMGAVGAGSCVLTSTTAGAKTLVAIYPGDGNFASSASGGAAHTVNPAPTTTTITSVSQPVTVAGQPYTVSFTVVAAAPGAGTPTGNVSVSDGTDSCAGTVAGGSCSLTSTTTGVKTLVATYAGDANFSTGFSAGVSHTVNLAGTTTTITSHTPDPSVVNQPLTVGVSVTSAFGTPTGSVTVSDGDGNSCTVALSGSTGVCKTLAPTSAGAKTLTADYTGDATHAASSDAVGHTVAAFGAAAALEFLVQPSSAPVDGTITPAVEVRVVDSFGNLVTSASAAISLTIATNPGGGALTGGAATAPVNGVATFAGLSIDQPGAGYTLTADDGSLPQATSAAFDIN